MPPTFDERIELLLSGPTNVATWRVMAHYLGESGIWWVLAMGRTRRIAECFAKSHAKEIERRGDRIAGVMIERWNWGSWREYRGK